MMMYEMDPRRTLSVIIPAFNEEKRLGSSLRVVTRFLSGAWDYEVIVVDDGSEDGTAAVVRGFTSADTAVRLVQAGFHRGKGYCVRLGMRAATKRFRLVCDADLSTPIGELENLYAWGEKGYDIVIGSRAHPDSRIEVRQSLFRDTLGKTFNLVVRALFGWRFRDTQCGFKLFSEKAASLFERQRIDGFSFDVETLVLAAQRGLSVKEVGVRWRNDPDTRVNLLTHPARMAFDLLHLRINAWRGLYSPIDPGVGKTSRPAASPPEGDASQG